MNVASTCLRWSLTLLLLVGGPCLVPAAAHAQPPGAEYALRFGDSLSVTVLGHPELSVQAQPIRPDGQISLPLVQAVRSQGRTIPDLTNELVKAYRPFLLNPQVVVTIARFRPLRVTVLGQVARPGALDFEEAPSLLDVLASAGGLTEQASRKAVKVVDPAGKTQVYDLDGLLARPGEIPRLAEGSVVEVGQVWGPDLYRVTIPLLAAFISSAVWLLRP